MRISFCRKVSILSSSLDDSTTAAAAGLTRGLQGLHSLQSLHVIHCPKFLSSYSSSSYSPFPTSLQTLELSILENFPSWTLAPLTNLTTLTITDCRDLICEDLWTFIAQGHLTKLVVLRSPKFFIGPEPSGIADCRLQELKTDDLSVPICRFLSSSLTMLQLNFDFNNEVERFTKEQEEALQLLTSLRKLRIFGNRKLQTLPAGLRVLTKLKTLGLSCSSFKSLPKGLPSSLEELQILDCPAIRSLPKDVLPRSLRELDVRVGNSEELRRQCRNLRGTVPIVRA